MTRRARASLALIVLGSSGAVFFAEQRASQHAVARAPLDGPSRAEQPPKKIALAREPDVAPRASFQVAPAHDDEASLMARLRSRSDQDPEFAVELAREGNARFPNSPDAPGRSAILIHALANVGRAAEARGEAEDMVNRYPDSSWVREIERFTGAHRHRNVHVASDGELAFD
jgi:hypothetical protein